ncbi:hypothetical protein RRG08_048558 [Elysia crispata]|uniref:Uncharacterized protein n=1 Tax=Elysia crispata TaxID=231223 RepID=A0AAE1B561_9GAST|nr:hypothetical protein RRG08_048558 [Elysia crispata]
MDKRRTWHKRPPHGQGLDQSTATFELMSTKVGRYKNHRTWLVCKTLCEYTAKTVKENCDADTVEQIRGKQNKVSLFWLQIKLGRLEHVCVRGEGVFEARVWQLYGSLFSGSSQRVMD